MTRTRTITLTLGSLAAGAILATGVTGLAVAADGDQGSSSASPSTASGQHESHWSRDADRKGGPRGERGGLMGEALHGEMVVKADDGTITTVRQVHGVVTKVSASSITVEAEDGYSATFTVTADTMIRAGLPDMTQGRPDAGTEPTSDPISDVAVGDAAHVNGTVSGSTATATRIHAMSAEESATMEQQRQQHQQERADATGSSTTQSS